MTDQPEQKETEIVLVTKPEPTAKKSNITAGMIDEIRGKDGMKPYTGMEATVTWFRKDHPDSRIHTDWKREGELFIFETLIYIGENLVSNAHGFYAGRIDGDALKKAETASVRRALSFLGYNARAALLELGRELVKGGVADRLGNGNGNRIGSNPQQTRQQQPAGNSMHDKAYEMVKEMVNHRKHFDHIVQGLQKVGRINPTTSTADVAAAVREHIANKPAPAQSPAPAATSEGKGASWLKGKDAPAKFLERAYKMLGKEDGALPEVLEALNYSLPEGRVIGSVLDYPGESSQAYGAVLAYAVGYQFPLITNQWLSERGFPQGVTGETLAQAREYCDQKAFDLL